MDYDIISTLLLIYINFSDKKIEQMRQNSESY